MSWLFSQALVAEFSADTCSDGGQSVPSKSNHIPQAYCSPDRMTEFSRLSRYGMTFAPLTADRGEDLLTSYLAAFRARTSAPPEKVLESPENAAACGSKWQELSVKYCLASSSWKTHHCLWEEVLPLSSVIFPRWGMTRNGLLFQHPTSERPINVKGCGWSAPTPTASDHKRTPMKKWYANKPKTHSTPDDLAKWAVRQSGLDHARLEPSLWEWMMAFPPEWTELKPLETGKFQQWLQQHGCF